MLDVLLFMALLLAFLSALACPVLRMRVDGLRLSLTGGNAPYLVVDADGAYMKISWRNDICRLVLLGL